MLPRFLLTNVLVAVAVAAGWEEGFFVWVGSIPDASVRMLACMGLMWLAGLCFAARRRWRAVYHVANALPMLGLVFTGLGIQLAGAGTTTLSASASLAMFHGILASLSTTFVGLALMMHLRELAFWMSGEHI